MLNSASGFDSQSLLINFLSGGDVSQRWDKGPYFIPSGLKLAGACSSNKPCFLVSTVDRPTTGDWPAFGLTEAD